jgi:hypothetical protein
MHLNKLTALAVAGLLAAGAAAGCSSSSKTTSTSAGNSTTTTASTGSGSGSNSGSGSGTVSLAQCVSAAAAYTKAIASAGAAIGGNQSASSQLQNDINSISGTIPSSLKDDYKTVADAYTKYVNDLKGAGTDASKLQAAGSDLNTSSVKTAAQHIGSYFSNHCKE